MFRQTGRLSTGWGQCSRFGPVSRSSRPPTSRVEDNPAQQEGVDGAEARRKAGASTCIGDD